MWLPSTWKEVFGYRLIGIGLTTGYRLGKLSKRTGEFRVPVGYTVTCECKLKRTFLQNTGKKLNDFKRKFVTHFCIPRVTQQTLSVVSKYSVNPSVFQA